MRRGVEREGAERGGAEAGQSQVVFFVPAAGQVCQNVSGIGAGPKANNI